MSQGSGSLVPAIPPGWRRVLEPQTREPYFLALESFLGEEDARHPILPARQEIFNALALTSYRNVRALILGQDPYATPGLAHGLAFSVRPGVTPPPSLRNIYRELADDVRCPTPDHGFLASWAKQGVLLLNAVLTVRAGEPNSHEGKGWESFTDEVIRGVSAKRSPVAFVLWGAYAQKKAPLIDAERHAIIASAHPSPLSARRGFFGSRPFSRVNDALREGGMPEIDWELPAL